MGVVRDLRWTARIGVALLVAGIACLVTGLVQLGNPVIEGAYFDRAVGAASEAVFAGTIDGRGWVLAGTVLVALGGALATVAAARSRR